MVRAAATAVTALALAGVGHPPAAAGAAAEPGGAHYPGERGCSALARVVPQRARAADLLLRCGFHVREITVTGVNRSLRVLVSTAGPEGGGAGDSLACRAKAPRRVHCAGDVSALTRIHIRLGVTREVCRAPRMRLGLTVVGGPECSGDCPAIAYRATLETSANRHKLGCAGS